MDATITAQDEIVKLKINSADLEIYNITDSTVGDLSLESDVFNLLVKLFKPIFVGIINLITYDQGLNLNNLLAMVGINFIKFGPTTITPFDEYFLLYTTPIFSV